MKISMKVKYVADSDNEAWEEEVDTETTGCLSGAPEGRSAGDYANMVIDYFNSTLKPGEMVRTLVSAKEI